MVLDVTYQTSQVSATLTYRRADDNSDTIDANSAAISVGSTVSFLVGMNATTQTSSALDAYYDNVLTVLQ